MLIYYIFVKLKPPYFKTCLLNISLMNLGRSVGEGMGVGNRKIKQRSWGKESWIRNWDEV